jgi:hypothetical protein
LVRQIVERSLFFGGPGVGGSLTRSTIFQRRPHDFESPND